MDPISEKEIYLKFSEIVKVHTTFWLKNLSQYHANKLYECSARKYRMI